MIQYRGEQIALVPLATPEAPTLTLSGASGETTYTYVCVAKHSSGHTAASVGASLTNGPDTLTILDRIDIRPPYVQGAESYDVYRTVVGESQGKIGSVVAYNAGTVQQAHVRDHGQAGDDADAPLNNTTGLLVSAGGCLQRASRTLSADQLKATGAPEYIVIPAPGEGCFVHILRHYLRYNFGTIAYDDDSGAVYIRARYGSASGPQAAVFAENWHSTVSLVCSSMNTEGIENEALEAVENQPVILVNDSGSDLTLGDGTALWVFDYEVIDMLTGFAVLV